MDQELNSRLAPLREKIDEIDAQLLALLNARARVALQVGEVKKAFDAPVFRPEREQQVIERAQSLGAGPLEPPHIEAIWREIMSASRALEKPLSAAFLGPVGTFSEEATYRYFGHSMQMLPCASIDEVFRCVETRAATYGVVPVENSTEGAISRTLDLLLRSPLPISGEVALPIHHQLLTQSGDLSGITRVCAHSQALAQCQRWLSVHLPQAERLSLASNAEAARQASLDPTLAAIASERAGSQYGLRVARPMIQDEADNRTRFFIIGGAPAEQTGRDQTSLILSVKNEPGAVYRLLAPFAENGVSMTRFESRPARTGSWAYYFYVDIEGHRAAPTVMAALEALDGIAAFVKVLGSYPRSS